MALYFCSQELGKKESSGTHGNIFHEIFEGTQSRVSINRSVRITSCK